ncbi:MAG: hypothetical protein U9N38_06105 [Thermodesulfobacteriota bacterium]|nr:hypothetical protein [Thermodesulfobacteriota bacterium]
MGKPKTQKEWFLTKLYSALQEFEDITGVEIKQITINREQIDDIGATRKTEITSYELEMR